MAFNPLGSAKPVRYVPDKVTGGGEEYTIPTRYKEKNGVLKGRDYVTRQSPIDMIAGFVELQIGEDTDLTTVQISVPKALKMGIDPLEFLDLSHDSS